jgi:prevent-host-death family protein
MRTTPLSRARAEFADIIDRALAGEPQRVTRHGKEAVVVVSETEWAARRAGANTIERPTVVDVLLRWSRSAEIPGEGDAEELFADRSWMRSRRERGADFAD